MPSVSCKSLQSFLRGQLLLQVWYKVENVMKRAPCSFHAHSNAYMPVNSTKMLKLQVIP